MKTKSLYLAALIVISAAVAAVGKDEPRSAGVAIVPVKGSEVFKLIYKSETASKVKLSIYDASAKVIFSETLSNVDGFIRPLNFSGLPFGEYTVEIADAAGKKIEKISFQPAKTTGAIHVSKLANEEGKFLLAVSKGASSQINVKIYDEANNLVHSETREVAADFAQLYTIKTVGSYTFEVSDNAGNTKTVRF
ncbi:hypothetical protein [Chryseolinea lacunae]|uniref:Secretion system C-terminal sorting domain-containing protein n=1 Tax=Chryseolinea lacunae TaxID=2801331 RepID=A0ABS1KKZ1_9BACT|nr:hypothetical protein [Chryseolinea lacunae]MBL0740116.1 hypothetical protein [Chryseolinea lacunae]